MGHVKLNVLGNSVLPIEGGLIVPGGYVRAGAIEERPVYRSSGEPNLSGLVHAFSVPGDTVDVVCMDAQTERVLGKELESWVVGRKVNVYQS